MIWVYTQKQLDPSITFYIQTKAVDFLFLRYLQYLKKVINYTWGHKSGGPHVVIARELLNITIAALQYSFLSVKMMADFQNFPPVVNLLDSDVIYAFTWSLLFLVVKEHHWYCIWRTFKSQKFWNAKVLIVNSYRWEQNLYFNTSRSLIPICSQLSPPALSSPSAAEQQVCLSTVLRPLYKAQWFSNICTAV